MKTDLSLFTVRTPLAIIRLRFRTFTLERDHGALPAIRGMCFPLNGPVGEKQCYGSAT
jgi:hypothetical protein